MPDAPYDDESWDIWTTGSISKLLPRVTAIWDVHGHETIQPASVLARPGVRDVYVRQAVQDFPHATVWTPWHLVTKYGRQLTGSMPIMLCEGIDRGYREITIYGCDMLEPGYEAIRESFVYLIGLGRGMGRKVEIARGSGLLADRPVYEYERKSRLDEFVEARIQKIRDTVAEKRALEAQARGDAGYAQGMLDALLWHARMKGE